MIRSIPLLRTAGDKLFVATLDGRQFRVNGPDRKTVETIQEAAVAGSDWVSVSAGGTHSRPA